eukprot:6459984-Amphidinium_carterae.1
MSFCHCQGPRRALLKTSKGRDGPGAFYLTRAISVGTAMSYVWETQHFESKGRKRLRSSLPLLPEAFPTPFSTWAFFLDMLGGAVAI